MKTIRLLLAIFLAAGLTNSRAQNTWTQKADFGGNARTAAVGFSIGDKGYIGTGLGSSLYKDFWEYNVVNDVWTQKANYGGEAMHGGAGFAIGNKGYIGLGGDLSGEFFKEFWEYDPVSNTWTKKADFGGLERYAVISFSIGNKGYIGAGFNWGPEGGNETYLKDFWEYDPIADSWTKKADFGGGGRQFAASFAIGTRGYAGTGTDGSYYKDFWEYDPIADTWTKKADFGGTARIFAAGFSIGSKGYIGTGSYSYYKDFWEYDPATDEWEQKSDYGGKGVYAPVGFSINGKGYLGTGENGANYKGFWEYTPGTTTPCAVPLGENTVDITATSAKLNWDVAASAIGYKIAYEMVSSNRPVKTTFEKSNSKEISNLKPNTLYSWQVKSVCSTDPKLASYWSAKQFFTTGTLKLGDEPITTLELYPNPVAENFTLDLRLNATANQSATIYLLNALGQIVYSSIEITSSGELSEGLLTVKKVITMPSTASAGWYVVRVVMNDQVIEQKLLYQK